MKTFRVIKLPSPTCYSSTVVCLEWERTHNDGESTAFGGLSGGQDVATLVLAYLNMVADQMSLVP